MIPLSLLLCIFQSMFAINSRTTSPSNLQSLLDTISNCTNQKSNEIQLNSIPEGLYIGRNIEIKNRRLELSGELSNKRASLGTRIIPQLGFDSNRNEAKFTVPICENCIFSLTNSTLLLDSLHFSLVDNSEESRQQRNKAHPARLAIVSGSYLTISQSIIEVSSGTSAILILPSPFEVSTTPSSVVVSKCSISSENGQLCGLVETAAFPDCGASRSISIVGCSFNSQNVLGTDGIGLSLTLTARKNAEDVGMISPSLIDCSFVNMSSSCSSRPPQLSHLSQKMLGCVVSLSSSHLSGSTIRDVNNGGSILCSNSSFSSLLSSPNTDSEQPSITLPESSKYPEQFEDGIAYSFNEESGDATTSASFSHCRFTGANYASNARALTFEEYFGTISIVSCSFANHSFRDDRSFFSNGGAIFVFNSNYQICPKLTLRASNFTNIKTPNFAAVYIDASLKATIVDCSFEVCRPEIHNPASTGGLNFHATNPNPSTHTTITNVVFQSCYGGICGGMSLDANWDTILSDCRFKDCNVEDYQSIASGLYLSLEGESPKLVTRLTFTDCWSSSRAAGMNFRPDCDVLLSDLHFFRCTSGNGQGIGGAGGFSILTLGQLLTLQDCSFVECLADSTGGAFHLEYFESCVMTDCLVKDCCSGKYGAITFEQSANNPWSISLTRVAFANNSVGQNTDSSASMNSADDTTAFVDVHLNYLDSSNHPTISIEDYFTTCATNSIGMFMTANRYTPQETIVRVFDDEFNKIGSLLTEKVVAKPSQQSGRLELEVKCNMPIASQKCEVTVQKEGDTTQMSGEIEFVNGKGTLTSPSPSLTLELSTSYTITSIVGIAPSSPSSHSGRSVGYTQICFIEH
ncbi:hypothetical protein BLNAU_17040 [Blattamonas nauphoetae]|uniref:Right handed beta helix domain-containing protein n=1 Tax=Blattamonas nauphoetae TaxID=2049346 RepID=A0ABQ9X8J7_9EUKA|nr:hypothetical protein BLNAU_17040 [Blattamonas nauphoetae]